MGNHTIDCPFCGADQRLVGSSCCKAYVEDRLKRENEIAARVHADVVYLEKFGFRPHSDALGLRTKLYASDVVRVLKAIEEKYPDLAGLLSKG